MASTRARVVYRSPTLTASYQPDRRSIARLAVSGEMRALLHRVVDEKALPFAQSISPYDSSTAQHYRDSFATINGYTTLPEEYPMRRVMVSLANLVPWAIIVELGSKRVTRHRVLGRTLEHLHSLGD
jgi:hypothetical protein